MLEFSPTFTELAKALVLARDEMGDVLKNASNPAFKSKYADLGAVVEAVQPALNKAKLASVQGVRVDYDGPQALVAIETMLLHESGEWVRTSIALRPSKSDPQGVGSAITYGRRYGLQTLCGVAPTDDDANAASKPGKDAAADEAALDRTPAFPTKEQLRALQATFDRVIGPETKFGAWLEEKVAPGLSKRAMKAPTYAEFEAAVQLLTEIHDFPDDLFEDAGGEQQSFDDALPVVPAPGGQAMTPASQRQLFAMLNERGIKEKADRIEFALGCRIEVASYSELSESQALYLIEMLRRIPVNA